VVDGVRLKPVQISGVLCAEIPTYYGEKWKRRNKNLKLGSYEEIATTEPGY
jgi:hypothetical protein